MNTADKHEIVTAKYEIGCKCKRLPSQSIKFLVVENQTNAYLTMMHLIYKRLKHDIGELRKCCYNLSIRP